PGGRLVLAARPDREVRAAGEGRRRVRAILTGDRERGPLRLAHGVGREGARGPRAVDVHVELAQGEVLVRATRGGARVAELGLADVLGRGDLVGREQVDVELDARLRLRGGELPDPLAVLLGGDLAARAPDEAGHGWGVIG